MILPTPYEADMYSLMEELAQSQRRQSREDWRRYGMVTAIAERCIAVRSTIDGGIVVSGDTDCVIRVARQLSLTRRQAEILVDEAIGLRESLPEVLDTLRDGITTRWQLQVILSRTALVPYESSITPDPRRRDRRHPAVEERLLDARPVAGRGRPPRFPARPPTSSGNAAKKRSTTVACGRTPSTTGPPSSPG